MKSAIEQEEFKEVEIDQEGFEKEYRQLEQKLESIRPQKGRMDEKLARLTELRRWLNKECDELFKKAFKLECEQSRLEFRMKDLWNEHNPIAAKELYELMTKTDEDAAADWRRAIEALDRAHGSPAGKCHSRHHKPREPMD